MDTERRAAEILRSIAPVVTALQAEAARVATAIADGFASAVALLARRPVTVICGSMRFEDDMRIAARHLSMLGHVVLMPHVNGKTEPLSDEDKARLDALHLDKIAAADTVVVVTRDWYIGESTQREIAHARALGKRVRITDYSRRDPLGGAHG